jgi:hypothetical protein
VSVVAKRDVVIKVKCDEMRKADRKGKRPVCVTCLQEGSHAWACDTKMKMRLWKDRAKEINLVNKPKTLKELLYLLVRDVRIGHIRYVAGVVRFGERDKAIP